MWLLTAHALQRPRCRPQTVQGIDRGPVAHLQVAPAPTSHTSSHPRGGRAFASTELRAGSMLCGSQARGVPAEPCGRAAIGPCPAAGQDSLQAYGQPLRRAQRWIRTWPYSAAAVHLTSSREAGFRAGPLEHLHAALGSSMVTCTVVKAVVQSRPPSSRAPATRGCKAEWARGWRGLSQRRNMSLGVAHARGKPAVHDPVPQDGLVAGLVDVCPAARGRERVAGPLPASWRGTRSAPRPVIRRRGRAPLGRTRATRARPLRGTPCRVHRHHRGAHWQERAPHAQGARNASQSGAQPAPQAGGTGGHDEARHDRSHACRLHRVCMDVNMLPGAAHACGCASNSSLPPMVTSPPVPTGTAPPRGPATVRAYRSPFMAQNVATRFPAAPHGACASPGVFPSAHHADWPPPPPAGALACPPRTPTARSRRNVPNVAVPREACLRGPGRCLEGLRVEAHF